MAHSEQEAAKDKTIDAQRARIAELEDQLEGYVWTYSPAMAQAKIDQLNEQLTAMTAERDRLLKIVQEAL